MKWFSVEGIKKEVSRVRWPQTKDVVKNSGVVITFCVLFGAFFVVAQFLISFFLQFIGVGA